MSPACHARGCTMNSPFRIRFCNIKPQESTPTDSQSSITYQAAAPAQASLTLRSTIAAFGERLHLASSPAPYCTSSAEPETVPVARCHAVVGHPLEIAGRAGSAANMKTSMKVPVSKRHAHDRTGMQNKQLSYMQIIQVTTHQSKCTKEHDKQTIMPPKSELFNRITAAQRSAWLCTSIKFHRT